MKLKLKQFYVTLQLIIIQNKIAGVSFPYNYNFSYLSSPSVGNRTYAHKNKSSGVILVIEATKWGLLF